MDSQLVRRIGYRNWAEFTLQSEKTLLARLPNSGAGVYIVRFLTPQPTMRGHSDIAYIGKSGNAQGICQRVRQYYHPGKKQVTCKRINSAIKVQHTEIAYVLLRRTDWAKWLEAALMHGFHKQHGQLPPLNIQRSRHPRAIELWDKIEFAISGQAKKK